MSNHAFSRVFGKGPEPALALHCTMGHSGAWRGVGEALGDRLTLTAIDLPGHGRSPDVDDQTDFHQACTDLARPFLTEAMHLIGHSFGATVALRLAVEAPEKVRSLTLIEPVFFAALKEDYPESFRTEQASAAAFAQSVLTEDSMEVARGFNRLWGDGTGWADIPQATRDYIAARVHLVPAQSAMIFEDNAGLMRPGVLATADMPALLLCGAHSPEVNAQINAALARRLGRARQAQIPGAGHMAPLTHPGAVADEIRLLLDMA